MTQLSYADVVAILTKLGELADTIVLVGGQALNFWAEHYHHRTRELTEAAPFTSKDIDFCGPREAVQACAQRLGGHAHFPDPFDPTPSSGLVIFTDSTGTQQTIDFLSHPFGLEVDEVLHLSIPIEVLNAIGQSTGVRFRVMHPVLCMESRVHNVVGLPNYHTPHGLKQLRASVACAREFLIDVLATGNVRAVLKLNERIFAFCYYNRHAREVYTRYSIDLFKAVLTASELPSIFLHTRYPQMLGRLTRRRSNSVDSQ